QLYYQYGMVTSNTIRKTRDSAYSVWCLVRPQPNPVYPSTKLGPCWADQVVWNIQNAGRSFVEHKIQYVTEALLPELKIRYRTIEHTNSSLYSVC
ncbi:hypothetical protein J6590_054666, partial [Homalodisca vitripennis]